MRQLVYDEISESDMNKVRRYLKKVASSSPLGNVFWVELPQELYNEVQQAHQGCQPFYFAIELDRKAFRVELLIRSRQKIHCECIGYANRKQLNYILDFVDKMIERLKIRT